MMNILNADEDYTMLEGMAMEGPDRNAVPQFDAK